MLLAVSWSLEHQMEHLMPFELFAPVANVDTESIGHRKECNAGEGCIDKVCQSLHFALESSAEMESSKYDRHRGYGNCRT